jgi:galactokinase/mevalonate kinase-like predicted kinase
MVVLNLVPLQRGPFSEVDDVSHFVENLHQVLGHRNLGLEVACICDIPAGSGMGGSSILGAVVIQSVTQLLEQRSSVDRERLLYQVNHLEQVD